MEGRDGRVIRSKRGGKYKCIVGRGWGGGRRIK